MSDYDVIVIGAGHNGLSCSLVLQKNGFKVLNVEKNGFVGGMAANIERWPGFITNAGAWMLWFAQKEIWELLELKKFGLELYELPTFLFNISSENEPAILMYDDPQEQMAHIAKDFGEEVMRGFMGLMQFMQPFGVGMKQAILNPPISIGKMIDAVPSIEGRDAMRKLFYRPVKDILYDFIKDEGVDAIMGLICHFALDGFYGGPMTPGSAFNLSFHLTSGEGTGGRLVKGGIGKYSETLLKAFEFYGGKIQLNSPVKKILIKNNKAVGVKLVDGQEIYADIVVSNCVARYTMELIGEENLPEQYSRMIKDIKYRNPFMQCYYRLKGLPEFEGRHQIFNKGKIRAFPCVGPGLMAHEECWDDCKHGRLPRHISSVSAIPTIYDSSLAPEGEHFWCQFVYFFPIDAPRSKWEGMAVELADKTLAEYARYAPNVKDIILDRIICAPDFYETTFNTTNGDFDSGTFAIEQMLDNRPVPGWSKWTTPVDNLYMCGAATHPGWGVTSVPGVNAVKAIIQNTKS